MSAGCERGGRHAIQEVPLRYLPSQLALIVLPAFLVVDGPTAEVRPSLREHEAIR